jgi:hypothetical protein
MHVLQGVTFLSGSARLERAIIASAMIVRNTTVKVAEDQKRNKHKKEKQSGAPQVLFSVVAPAGDGDHMPNYTARVELRGNPPFEKYEKLHALMKNKGFLQTITNDQGTWELPHATYYGWSTDSCGSVRNSVRDEVKTKIQNDIVVFVAQTEDWGLGW